MGMWMTKLELDIMTRLEYSTFVKIIADIPSCIFFKDTDLRYIFSSHCWAQLNSDDIVGKTDVEIRKDKENAIKAMEADREIIRTGKGVDYIIKSDIDGEISYLQLIKEPIIENGKVIGIVGLINDVTEKTLMKDELEEANTKLKETLENLRKRSAAQKLFTASMNHELRSPLNSIIGLLSLLQEDKTLNESQHQNVYYAQQSAKLMLGIVNDLLDFAKMETKEFNIVSEVFSLDALVANLDFSTHSQASEKGLKFILEYEKNSQMLIGDEKRIRQIGNNLLSNAIKYTEQGWVRLSVEYAHDNLIIVCEDSGQGISSEALKTLFDPYVRFNEKNNKSIQGTGLGMSIVKSIIEKMSGEIKVESEVSVGTKVTVKLPIHAYVATTPEDALSNSVANSNNENERDYSKLKVLCVDDAVINLQVVTKLLETKGIEVDKASSGFESIKLAHDKKYDLIFMDHMMSKCDGVETMKNIHNNCEKNKETPIVMLTGNSGEQESRLYQEAGAAGYLVKPITKEELIKCIDDVLFK